MRNDKDRVFCFQTTRLSRADSGGIGVCDRATDLESRTDISGVIQIRRFTFQRNNSGTCAMHILFLSTR
jgi:hypothetical protein